MSATIEIVEVAPRDGLQNEKTPVSTEDKLHLINRLIAAGANRIEAVSFVNPKRVPQMADAEAVMDGVPRDVGVSYAGLVLNRRGVDRALAAGVDEINFVVVASDTFAQRNQGASTAEQLDVWEQVAAAAREAGKLVSVTIAAAFGCPFEGEVPIGRLVEVAARAAAAKPDELVLADTIGVGSPGEVVARFNAVRKVAAAAKLRAHFHNTRNTGIANAYAAVTCGVTTLDASVGGIGGCPFAPAATGNVPTEDLAYMFGRMERPTSLDLAALIDTAKWLEGVLRHTTPSMLAKAGVFPPQRAA